MIFSNFDPNQDIVAGRTSRIASGFWPDGYTNYTQTNFVDDFWGLTGSGTPSPSYGTSIYDVRRTMYYANVYPNSTYLTNNDPYFSVSYGNINGGGSFNTETSSILASPTKAVYTQFKNMLLGTSDLDGLFSMQSGSTTVNATDIWAISFSSYKMKDRVDEGMLQISFNGPNGTISLIDDSPYVNQTQTVYQLFCGTIDNRPNSPNYEGLGLFYPSNGIIILNAALLAEKLGITDTIGISGGPIGGQWVYSTASSATEYTYNHKTLIESMKAANADMYVRKSEYVPGRHYFVHARNREFNYSNNPTYVYDGTDGQHSKGTIKISDFITDPKTYITTVGLYNENNELVAVGKLSRPAMKDFTTELHIKCLLQF